MTAKQAGQYLAKKMATQRKPLTKREMLRRWSSLGNLGTIDAGIDWIEANTPYSNNPFLFLWDRGEARWGFRNSYWGGVAPNLSWNLGYMRTRFSTFERVLDHAISSPVVQMTPKEKVTAKSVLAQTGGIIAYIDSMAKVLP